MDSLEELLAHYRRCHSPQSMGKIIEHEYHSIYLSVLQKVNATDAQDVTQNVVLQIAKSLHNFRGETAKELKGWWYAIARAQIARFYYDTEKRAESSHPDFDEFWRLVEEYAVANKMTETELLELREINEQLKKADPECYELIFRRHVLDTDYATLGNDYGISKDAARMRVERCIEKYLGGQYAKANP